GLSDALVLSDSSNSFSVQLGTGMGGFTPGGTFAMGGYPVYLAVGDLDNDSKLDVVTTDYNSGDIASRFGDGAGGFGSVSKIQITSYGPSVVVITDFNGDNKQDLAVACFDGSLLIFIGDGAGGFAAPKISVFDSMRRVNAVSAADFNLD